MKRLMVLALAAAACVAAPNAHAQGGDPVAYKCPGVQLAPALNDDKNPDGTTVRITPDSRGKYVPVVVVHGWTGKSTHDDKREGAFSHKIDLTTNQLGTVQAARSLVGQFQRNPGAAVFTFDYHQRSANWVDDAQIGPALGAAIDCLHEASGEKVIVVAHSMGGLATRHALGQEPGRADKVSSVVTFGTPNTGSLVAMLANAVVTGAGVTKQGAVLRMLLAACGTAATSNLDTGTPCDILPAQVRAADSAAGRALRSGSSQLKALKPFPDKVRVHALAGDTAFTVPKIGWFALPWETDNVPMGDLVVMTDSATQGADAVTKASCSYQLSPVRGATDAIGLAMRVISRNDVAQPVTSAMGACFHGNLMRSIQLTNEATGIVNDDIAGRAPKTTVRNVTPVDEAGNPAPGYTVTDEPDEIDCSVNGASYPSPASVGKNIVTCSPGAASVDVCWAQPDRYTALCAWDPREKTLRRHRSTTPLFPVGPAEDPAPWAIDLDNGDKCRIRNGGSWPGRSDDLVGAYACSGQDNVVLAPQAGDAPTIDKTAGAWTVQYGVLDDKASGSPAPETVGVRVAYFAASP
ncbi:hypothetical protein L6E12_17070 [Actinokineospora sp. PR83]|uniref:esterase/lipase family protein n=1 Tax=Actinokineospora sp. PR83 TaxID=2884908 RepID=UPI0027DF9737|nr:hypothetical protein [Actinokineospora sp. PR83]MCG8917498.1 hypothetical protein [Actinokineospora sp. PR83]